MAGYASVGIRREETVSPMSSPNATLSNPAPVFAALGDTTRLSLVARLRDGRARSIAQLTEGLDITRQGVTKHLRILERAGIVTVKRVGREARFVFTPSALVGARDYLDGAARQWDRAIEGLQAFVDDEQKGGSLPPREDL